MVSFSNVAGDRRDGCEAGAFESLPYMVTDTGFQLKTYPNVDLIKAVSKEFWKLDIIYGLLQTGATKGTCIFSSG
jgi:hypothetical protein